MCCIWDGNIEGVIKCRLFCHLYEKQAKILTSKFSRHISSIMIVDCYLLWSMLLQSFHGADKCSMQFSHVLEPTKLWSLQDVLHYESSQAQPKFQILGYVHKYMCYIFIYIGNTPPWVSLLLLNTQSFGKFIPFFAPLGVNKQCFHKNNDDLIVFGEIKETLVVCVCVCGEYIHI